MGNLSFDLTDQVVERGSLKLLRAELPKGVDPVCAWIRYALDGVEQPDSLRLDLFKQVFLDHFEEEADKERLLQESAPKIVEFLYSRLHPQGSKVEHAADLNLGGVLPDVEAELGTIAPNHRSRRR